MINAIKKTPEENGQYPFVQSTDTATYPATDWAHDPDISAVADVPREYWKWDGSVVVEMTEAEKELVDDYGMDVTDDMGGVVRIDVSNDFPKSKLAGSPIAVHASYKPEIEDGQTFAVWSGAGDDMNDPINGNGNGPLLQLRTEIGKPQTIVDIEFNRIYGRVWLHEAYIKFMNGGIGDSVSSVIMSYPVPVQTMAYLDLILDGEYIKYSPLGPGTGTHGFADPTKITLVDRGYQKDGEWNYSPSEGLTPNFAGTGRYRISTVEQVVHRYVNRIPVYGDCATYFSMSSDETTELLPGYFARVIADNVSNTEWSCSVLMELYRQVTYSP